jgi:putative hemolysin
VSRREQFVSDETEFSEMMDIYLVLFFTILLVFDLLLVATRFAYLNTSQARLLGLRETLEKKINIALSLTPLKLRLKAALGLAFVLTRFFLAGTLLIIVNSWASSDSIWLAFLILVCGGLILFWLEWLVERWVIRNPELWAVRLAGFGRAISYIFIWGTAPPLLILGEPADSGESINLVTEEDLKSLVDVGQEEGLLEIEEKRMIYSIFKLSETLAREIMVPRIDMVALDVNTSTGEAVEVMLHSGHSRVPVYEDTVDQTLGVLYVKDLLQAVRDGQHNQSLHKLLRSAYFIPEAKRLDTLLAEMQSQRIHIAIVVDEYGGVAGLVTLEDIVEEIVGEIQDEYDQEEEMPFQVLPDGQYVFLGRVDLDDFNEIIGSHLSNEDADTIGGYIYSKLGRVPGVGEKVLHDNLLLTVEQVSTRRIRKVRAQWLPQITPEEIDLDKEHDVEQSQS